METLADRKLLYEEIHARPIPSIGASACVTHFAVLSPKHDIEEVFRHLAELTDLGDGGPLTAQDLFVHADCGAYELRWEKHSEFDSYTFTRHHPEPESFCDTALDDIPPDWLARLPGKVVATMHVALTPNPLPEPGSPAFEALFEDQQAYGGKIVDERAVVWASMRLDSAGYSRFVVGDVGLSDFQRGRTVQRLLEFETYRIMALLGLPAARKLMPLLYEADQKLAAIMRQVTSKPVDEQALFDQLSELAATTERMRADHEFRFTATRAYHQLARRRLSDLREVKFPGRPTMNSVIERRFTPAMDTCSAIHERLEALSERIARASELMRTQLEISNEAQNSELLQAMNRRLNLQLRLQQTVEGLSVAAISYYSIGLLEKLIGALPGRWLPMDTSQLTAILIIPVVAIVWVLVRSVRRHVTRASQNISGFD